MTLSGAIVRAPERFTAEALVHSAEELLRRHGTSPLHDALAPSILDFYGERRLVDPPAKDEEGAFYNRRHLLQLMAVQVLRGLELNLEEIGALVRGVDDKHLRMLIDDPEEAEKKANVMRNWIGMIAKGRYRPRPGKSGLIDSGAFPGSGAADGEPPPFRPGVSGRVMPAREPPPVPAGLVSKRTVMGTGSRGADSIPDPAPDDLPTSSVPILAQTRRARPSARPPATVPHRATLPAGARRDPGGPTSRAASERISDGFIVGDRYVRHVLAEGIELHVSARAAASRVDAEPLEIMIGRLRALLQR